MVTALVDATLDNRQLILRIAVAAALGAAVGLEREASDQPAGLRTHISVALGAALFGVISVAGWGTFQDARNNTNFTVDVSRVASQVVVGIGFLGAGAIIKEGLRIRGLTTAASLWVTAAVGLAAGVGSFAAAVITTVALLGSLLGLRHPRSWLRTHLGRRRATVVLEVDPDADLGAIVSQVNDLCDIEMKNLTVRRSEDTTYVEIELRGQRGNDIMGRLTELGQRADVRDVDVT